MSDVAQWREVPIAMAVTCDECVWFNPYAGLGSCSKGHGPKYPLAPHYCREREEFQI